MLISLWDLDSLGRLPISGKIYDETVSTIQAFEYWDKQNLKTIPSSCKFLFASFRSLEKMPICEKGISSKARIDFWCKKKLIHNPPTWCCPLAQLPQGCKILVARFSLKIFVGVMMNWTYLEAWRFPKRRGRTPIFLHSCHVGCVLLYFLRPRRSSFARELLRSLA